MDSYTIPDNVLNFDTSEEASNRSLEISDLAHGRALVQIIRQGEKTISDLTLADWLKDKLENHSFGERYLVTLLKATSHD